MALELPDSWVWDCWLADDGDRYHLFFLFASRALHDPDARHSRASVGHAVSDDLVNWTRVADALVRGDAPAFDDAATWTGSVLRDPAGGWRMFYTGLHRPAAGGSVQRIGMATSDDLATWTKSPDNPVLRADPRWYEVAAGSPGGDEDFRDPWVFADPDGDGWHMLITARAPSGDPSTRGVIGHAVSPDLRTWEVRPPLAGPADDGFGVLEVLQVEQVDGRWAVLFCCFVDADHALVRGTGTTGGMWTAPADSPLGPFHLDRAIPIADSSRYAGRLMRRRSDGRWVLLAFEHDAPGGGFGGRIVDPVPVAWSADGSRLEIERA